MLVLGSTMLICSGLGFRYANLIRYPYSSRTTSLDVIYKIYSALSIIDFGRSYKFLTFVLKKINYDRELKLILKNI